MDEDLLERIEILEQSMLVVAAGMRDLNLRLKSDSELIRKSLEILEKT